MVNKTFDLAGLIVGGVIVAGLIMPKNVPGTKALINGLTGLWQTSVNGLLGQTG